MGLNIQKNSGEAPFDPEKMAYWNDWAISESKPTLWDNADAYFTQPDYMDEYFRTPYVQARDRFFGVEKYQLDQRYGREKHEVVPHVHVRDWVDDLGDSIDALVARLPWMKP